MPVYSGYYVNKDHHICEVYAIRAETDQDAMAAARRLLEASKALHMEVWLSTRRVGKVQRDS